ncbi:hypothetical protein FACS189452_05630 [Bacteroidia bacterium]|nr:hypothetical protein FACS189452_05630 [Bacteroidia bacterium]GHT82078.1 hypothetical protein FACS189467_7030 [Bacteroidia bacterium]
MEFHTQIDIPPLLCKIGYEHKIMFVGSCFATAVGARMQQLKFAAMVNPFGTLYNPVSVAQSLKMMSEKRLFTASGLHCEQGLWCSYTHHSRFAHPDKNLCLQQHNESILRGAWGLKTADFLVITLGTSWAYRLKKTGEVVANCHKTPAKEFEHFMLQPNEIADLLTELVQNLQCKNPQLQIIFTVSPIRHWKDGAHGNQLSKAALLLAIDDVLHATQGTHYFPAYEIMLDELRDYRFYADDMQHPSDVAVDYIWEKFAQSVLSESTFGTMAEIKKLLAAKAHRPFNANTPEYKVFLQTQYQNLLQLSQQFPHLDWAEEENYFATE